MNPAALTLLGILIFTAGLVIGYITGWQHGVQRGFSTGWVHAMQEIRRLVARMKGPT